MAAAALVAAVTGAGAAEAATNGRISFSSFRDGGQGRIYTMAPDGSDQRGISAGSDAQSDWSPDGGSIAFRRGTTTAYEVWTMGAGGEAPRQLTDTPGSANSSQPSWLPNGSGLLFRRGATGSTDVWRMAPDGSGQAPVVTVPADQWYPSASPATGRILFATTVTSSDRKIQDAAPDGGDVRTLRDTVGAYDSGPAYSPDGRRIAFESDALDADGTRDTEIYVMDADGGGLVQLTRNGEHDEGPVFSPDGSQIVFTRGADNADGDIWAMNADGSGERNLTRTPGQRDESPDWQPLPDPATPADPATPPPTGTGSIGVSPLRASGVALRLAGRKPRLTHGPAPRRPAARHAARAGPRAAHRDPERPADRPDRADAPVGQDGRPAAVLAQRGPAAEARPPRAGALRARHAQGPRGAHAHPASLSPRQAAPAGGPEAARRVALALAGRRGGAGRAGVDAPAAIDDDLDRRGRLPSGRPQVSVHASLMPVSVRGRGLWNVHAPVAPVVVRLAVDLVVVDDHGRVRPGRRIEQHRVLGRVAERRRLRDDVARRVVDVDVPVGVRVGPVDVDREAAVVDGRQALRRRTRPPRALPRAGRRCSRAGWPAGLGNAIGRLRRALRVAPVASGDDRARRRVDVPLERRAVGDHRVLERVLERLDRPDVRSRSRRSRPARSRS